MAVTFQYGDYLISTLVEIPPKRMTVEQRILDRLRKGPVVGLFCLAIWDLGIEYSWASVVIKRMEREGKIKVTRRPGKPMRLEIHE